MTKQKNMNCKELYSSAFSCSKLSARREINNMLNSVSHFTQLKEDVFYDIKVILNELIQNAIKYGDKFNTQKKIYVDIWMDKKNSLNISVEDQGIGFDYNKKIVNTSNSSRDIFDLKESGRGLLIVDNLCESIIYNEIGNKVTVTKKIL